MLFRSTFPAADVPVDLGMSSTRTVYVAKTNNEIASITSAGVVALTFAKLPAGSNPNAIVTDFGGYSYTANFGTGTISQISPAGGVVEYAALGAGAGPFDLTRDSKGRLWVANALTDTVVAFDTAKPAGTAPVATYTLPRGSAPRVLTHDEFDNIFVAGDHSHGISVITPDNGKVASVVATTRWEPGALAVTSDGRLLFSQIEDRKSVV